MDARAKRFLIIAIEDQSASVLSDLAVVAKAKEDTIDGFYFASRANLQQSQILNSARAFASRVAKPYLGFCQRSLSEDDEERKEEKNAPPEAISIQFSKIISSLRGPFPYLTKLEIDYIDYSASDCASALNCFKVDDFRKKVKIPDGRLVPFEFYFNFYFYEQSELHSIGTFTPSGVALEMWGQFYSNVPKKSSTTKSPQATTDLKGGLKGASRRSSAGSVGSDDLGPIRLFGKGFDVEEVESAQPDSSCCCICM